MNNLKSLITKSIVVLFFVGCATHKASNDTHRYASSESNSVYIGACERSADKKIKNNYFNIKFSDGICDSLSNKIENLLNNLFVFKRGNKTNVVFDRLYPGKNFEGVAKYLADRIHYITVKDVELNRQLALKFPEYAQQLEDNEQSPAENISGMIWGLWLLELSKNKTPLKDISLDGFNIKYPEDMNTRIGLIRFKYANPFFTDNMYLKFLAHEARHSDCTGGAFKIQNDELTQVNPDNMRCFNQHVKCRASSQITESMCDQQPWGAYTFDYVLIREILGNCTNCGFSEDLLRINLLATLEYMNFIPEDLYMKIHNYERTCSKPDVCTFTSSNYKSETEQIFLAVDRYLKSNIKSLDLVSKPLIE